MLKTFHENTYLLEALNSNEAEYLVIGGLAVHYYVSERVYDPEVNDIDLLINPTIENASRVKESLFFLLTQGFGFYSYSELASTDSSCFTKRKYQLCLKAVSLTMPKRRLNADLVTPHEGFDFLSSYEYAVRDAVNDVSVHIVSVFDLARLKNSKRKKDQDDLQLLRQAYGAFIEDLGIDERPRKSTPR